MGFYVYGWFECLHHVFFFPEEVHAKFIFKQKEKVHVYVELLEPAFIAASQTPQQIAVELQSFGMAISKYWYMSSFVSDFLFPFLSRFF